MTGDPPADISFVLTGINKNQSGGLCDHAPTIITLD